MLFSDRSLITMVHGIGLSGGALVGLAAAFVALILLHGADNRLALTTRQARLVTALVVASTAGLWLSVLAGTYGVFPLYRMTPPPNTLNMAQYPRALLLANPETAWLHGFAMELKEHVPWIAAMLATAPAAIVWRDPRRALSDRGIYRPVVALIAVSLVLASAAGLLGILVNKVAPVQ
jgi:hypothetical protein